MGGRWEEGRKENKKNAGENERKLKEVMEKDMRE